MAFNRALHLRLIQSASILAALANGSILLITAGAIVWEAIRRFSESGGLADFLRRARAKIGTNNRERRISCSWRWSVWAGWAFAPTRNGR